MPHNRYYLNTPLSVGSTVSLDGEEGHHLVRVMRAREKDIVELINGQGQLALCTVEKIEKQKGILRIDDVVQEEQPTPSIILALSYLRPSSMEWAIEKATELGATTFWLFPAARSEKKEFSAHQQERLKAIIMSACKQCGRLYLPEIIYKKELTKLDLCKETEGMSPFLCEIDAPYLRSEKAHQNDSLLLFIGPEGGFSDQEKQALLTLKGLQTVRLHPNILRAETAPLAALSILYSQVRS